MAVLIPITGIIRTAAGNLFNGIVRFFLSYGVTHHLETNQLVLAEAVAFPVNNGSLPTGARITPNDVLHPANTAYVAQYVNRSGDIVAQNVFYISGDSFDIGSAIPTPLTTSNISFDPKDLFRTELLNWTQQVTFSPGVQLSAPAVQGGGAGVRAWRTPALIVVNLDLSLDITAPPTPMSNEIRITLPLPASDFVSESGTSSAIAYTRHWNASPGPNEVGSLFTGFTSGNPASPLTNVLFLYNNLNNAWAITDTPLYVFGQILLPLA